MLFRVIEPAAEILFLAAGIILVVGLAYLYRRKQAVPAGRPVACGALHGDSPRSASLRLSDFALPL